MCHTVQLQGVLLAQGMPEFVTRTEKAHLRMNGMSRSRSCEKVRPSPALAPSLVGTLFTSQICDDLCGWWHASRALTVSDPLLSLSSSGLMQLCTSLALMT